MPLWHIYCPENAYSAEDKCALATRITDLYADVGLPRFYASVVFHELPPFTACRTASASRVAATSCTRTMCAPRSTAIIAAATLA